MTKERIQEWLRANGVDPGVTPADARARTGCGRLVIEQYEKDPVTGSLVLDTVAGELKPRRTMIVVPLAEPWPDDLVGNPVWEPEKRVHG
jgi:hypothetical protein